jgi:hypothetical protein
MKPLLILLAFLLLHDLAGAQTIQYSNRSTRGYIKSDGTVQNSSRSTIGYIKNDGTIHNSSRSTVGYAKGIPREWAAVSFFFFSFRESQ